MDPALTQALADIKSLQAQVKDLSEWKADRTAQQLFHPVDDLSKIVFGALMDGGAETGIALTHSVSVPAAPTSITVARTPDGTRLVNLGGVHLHVPFFLS